MKHKAVLISSLLICSGLCLAAGLIREPGMSVSEIEAQTMVKGGCDSFQSHDCVGETGCPSATGVASGCSCFQGSSSSTDCLSRTDPGSNSKCGSTLMITPGCSCPYRTQIRQTL